MSFNVLIVDDSRSMRAVIKKTISMSGFKIDQCVEAGNGREALDVLAKSWVDVIISDINMPEMNGFEFLEELKKDSLLKAIPAIVISTEGSEKRIQNAFELGAKGFIKKPFLPEEIKKVLYEVIGVSDEGEYKEDKRDDDAFDF
ncbi:MAG: response regulator [Deltaproteobacteria bacterium]|nr:response regulator [Deltaproteobacteria bacterium]MBW1718861.1 response regulator [Deltaproteobacteria bacterium]MBW2080979.1 response regulator [Deltaproteobacteria bacterium]MBW2350737.1 response regulator [Deltaproteobacteria bacterium]